MIQILGSHTGFIASLETLFLYAVLPGKQRNIESGLTHQRKSLKRAACGREGYHHVGTEMDLPL